MPTDLSIIFLNYVPFISATAGHKTEAADYTD